MKIDPVRAKNLDGPEQAMKKIELLEKAASSVSDGDLVDAMIHSYVHGIFILYARSQIEISGQSSIGHLCLYMP